jgi:S1-C subfamily serine protease
MDKKVTLRPRAGDQVAAKGSDEKKDDAEPKVESPKTVAFSGIGFTVRGLSPQEQKTLKVENGVIVSDVKPFSEADKRAIGKGDVILEADRKQIITPGELKKAIESRKVGDSVLLRVRRQADGATAFIAVQVLR